MGKRNGQQAAELQSAEPIDDSSSSNELVEVEAENQEGIAAMSDPTPQVDPEEIPGSTKVKARVLVDCAHGKCNQVVEVDASALLGLAGVLDSDPAAVAYAESLVDG